MLFRTWYAGRRTAAVQSAVPNLRAARAARRVGSVGRRVGNDSSESEGEEEELGMR